MYSSRVTSVSTKFSAYFTRSFTTPRQRMSKTLHGGAEWICVGDIQIWGGELDNIIPHRALNIFCTYAEPADLRDNTFSFL